MLLLCASHNIQINHTLHDFGSVITLKVEFTTQYAQEITRKQIDNTE